MDRTFIKVIELLNLAKRNEIDIVLNGKHLQLKFPENKNINESLLHKIKENKNLIVEFLSNDKWKLTEDNNIFGRINKYSKKLEARIPLSFSQERLWFIDRLEGSVQYHIPVVLRLRGGLNTDIFGKVMRSIVDRHEVLRTVIGEYEGEAYQYIKEGDEWELSIIDGSSYKDDDASLQQYIRQLIARPFNLSKDYMLRAALITLTEQEQVLVATMHHIASDGWSVSVLVKELSELYGFYHEGQPSRLPPLVMQYADYAIWQRDYFKEEILEAKISYWKEKLQGVASLQLPVDYVRPSVQSTKGSVVVFRIDREVSEGLQLLSRQQEATMFMTLLAGFKVLLHRYSGQKDICVGTPVANRTQKEAEELIGYFVNTLAIRDEVDVNVSFTSLLQQVKATMLEAYEHQEAPFEKVVDASVKERDMSRTPLFQVMFVLQNTPDIPRLQLGELTISGEGYEQTRVKFDITFTLKETSFGLQGSVQYCTELYNRQTIERMIGHYRELLGSIVQQPQQKIGLLPMLSKAEEEELLTSFGSSSVEYAVGRTIVEIIEDQATRMGGAIALVCEGEELTYKELNERSNRLGHYLRKRGVGEETLVPVCIERSIGMVVGIVGILKAGGAYVPIDPGYPRERIEYMVSDTGAAVVVSSAEGRINVGAREGVEIIEIDGDWGQISDEAADNTERSVGSGNLVYVIYTSGSTGRPKGVMIEHGSLLDHCYGVIKSAGLEGCGSFALFSPLVFDAGHSIIHSCFIVGGSLHILGKELILQGDRLREYVDNNEIDCIKIVPSLWLSYADGGDTILSKKVMIFGGEAFSGSIGDHLVRSGYNGEVYNHYGPTEATIGKSIYKIDINRRYVSVPIGKPFSNTRIYIVNSVGELVPAGVAGEIWIGGEGVARGYLNQGELTEEKFILDVFSKEDGGRIYKTGDLGYWLSDGNIEYLGRKDEQVKIRGYRIEVGEIESVLMQSELVSQAVVCAGEDREGNKRLVGYVVAKEDFRVEGVTEYLRGKLPEYMIPMLWVEIERVPLTSNGKVDRKALPEVAVSALSEKEYTAPRTEMEEKLAGIWQKLLGIEKIGVHDNFFDLGGHSLMASRIVSSVRKILEVEMVIKDLFVYSTIARLAAYIQVQHKGLSVPSVSAQERPDLIPLSFSQERLWFIDQLEGSVQYHIPAVLRLKGHLNKEALDYALKNIVNRHEVLRTVFYEEEDKPYQYIKEKDEWKITFNNDNKYDSEQDSRRLQQYIQQLINKPFDLSQDHMLRATLITLGELKHILVITLHHIASDGWSTSILVKEVVELYSSYEEKRLVNLIPLQMQYADYAIWQRTYMEEKLLNKKIVYWKEKLEGIAPLNLPADYARPALQSRKGAVSEFILDKDLSHQIQLLSQQQGVTLFMLLLAAFKVLLHRYSGQDDIIVGTSIAGRQQHEIEGLIGYFINGLALRSTVNENEVFTTLLQQIKVTCLEAYENQEVPFEKVVNAVVKKRDLSRSPLFDVLFILQNVPEIPELRLGKVLLTNEAFETNTSKFDLNFTVLGTASGLQVQVQYCTDLYNKSTIVRMMEHFQVLLKSIVKNPNQKVGMLPILTEKEKHTLLIEFNNTQEQYPKNKSITNIFEEQVINTPDNIAVVFEQKELSYQQLNNRANQLGYYLRSKGVCDESIIPICIERSLEMMVGILGILKAGAAFVPIDPEYPQDRINHMLQDTAAFVVISSKKSKSKLQFFNGFDIIELDDEKSVIHTQQEDNLLTDVKASSLAYVIYTSGSTGKPKGVMVEHGSVINLIYSIAKTVGFTSESVFLSVTTYSFDICYLEVFMPILLGGKLIVAGKEIIADGFKLAESITFFLPTHMQGTPSTWQLLLNSEWKNKENIKILIGGEPVKESIKDTLTKIGTVFNVYGPTETTIWSTINKLDIDKKVLIGKPLSNTSIYILNKQQQLSPVGVFGEICIGGVGLARGYFKQFALTSEKFVPDPFTNNGKRLYKTGDLGRWLADGNIEHLGRIDNQVKIRGYRIELGEIESILQQSGLVIQSVVLAREDEGGNRRLVGYIVTDGLFNKEAITSYLSKKLPDYMIPALWMKLESLPLTPNGKIDRKALPELDINAMAGKEYIAPRNEQEAKLVDIWKELLHLDKVGIDDNFFELGGDSILSIQVVTRMRRLGYELQPKDIFIHQTVRMLWGAIEENLKISAQQNPLTDSFGLLPVQQRYFEIQHEHISCFSQNVLLLINKNVTQSELNNVVRQLIKSHDALHFKYFKSKEKWQLAHGFFEQELITEDLRLIPDNLWSSLIEEYVDAHQQSLDIGKGKLIQIVWLQMPEPEINNRLLIIVHRLAIDNISWRILLEDIELLINELKTGNSTNEIFKSSSYVQWYNALEKYGQSRRLQSQIGYWQKTVKKFYPLKVNKIYIGEIRLKDTDIYSINVNARQTQQLLKEVLPLHQAELAEILLCILAKTLCKWNNADEIVIGLENEGRTEIGENIPLSHTVGWFTNLYPVLLMAKAGSSEIDLIMGIKKQLRNVPDKGLGYGVLKYINKEEAFNVTDCWDITFNHVTNLNSALKNNNWLKEAKELARSATNSKYVVREKLSVYSLMANDELIINWNYSKKHFTDKTIVAIAADYLSNLENLINNGGRHQKFEDAGYEISNHKLTSKITYQEADRFLEEDDDIHEILSF